MNSKTGSLLFIAPVLLVSAIAISCSSPQTPQDVVRAYIDAHNRHDVTKAMSFMSDEIQFEMSSGWIRYGKDQIRQLQEWDSATAGTLNVSELTALGDTISCRLTEQNDWFRLLGIDTIHYDSARFIFHEGSIIAIRAIINDQSVHMIQNAFIAMRNWARTERPEALDMLMPKGDFIYDAALAEPWLTLLREWRQATGQD